VFGSSIAEWLGQRTGVGPLLQWGWTLANWPTLVLAVLAASGLLYAVAPARRQPLRWITAGSLLATPVWLLFTAAFAMYVNRFAAPTETYGALAGVAILMLHVYGTAVTLLLGAEMNRVLAEHAQGADVAG
jgi:membrane protein